MSATLPYGGPPARLGFWGLRYGGTYPYGTSHFSGYKLQAIVRTVGCGRLAPSSPPPCGIAFTGDSPPARTPPFSRSHWSIPRPQNSATHYSVFEYIYKSIPTTSGISPSLLPKQTLAVLATPKAHVTTIPARSQPAENPDYRTHIDNCIDSHFSIRSIDVATPYCLLSTGHTAVTPLSRDKDRLDDHKRLFPADDFDFPRYRLDYEARSNTFRSRSLSLSAQSRSFIDRYPTLVSQITSAETGCRLFFAIISQTTANISSSDCFPESARSFRAVPAVNMPISLQAPVLQVDANVIHKVDTSNPENLFSMWTGEPHSTFPTSPPHGHLESYILTYAASLVVFARCADSVAQGRRLENLSWRLWNRETFCCDNATSSATTAPQDIQRTLHSSASDDLPQLSGSVESVIDEEAVELTTDIEPVDILRPRIQRQDSCASSRRRHITSDNLEKMVVSIVEAKVPFDAPLPNITASFPLPVRQPRPVPIPSQPELQRSGSTTTEASPTKTSDLISTNSSNSPQQTPSPIEVGSPSNRTNIVRGFTPVPVSMSSRILSQAGQTPSPSAIPEPKAAPAPKLVQPRKAKFALGVSSGEDSYSDHSLDTRKQPVPQIKKKMFQIGGSSEDSSVHSALNSSASPQLAGQRKGNPGFSNLVATHTGPSTSAVDEDQSETDYVDESAIDDDDDSSDWEDSLEESGKSSMEEFNFKRVDSTANLTSRRSLITLMLAQNDRSQRHGPGASQSVSAVHRARTNLNGPSMVHSPNDSDDAALMMMRATRPPPMRPINEIPRSSAQPIMTNTTSMHHQAALSPRTTRRNMLATELTESLRRHLLWERSQKTSTANAVLKRRHTSHDVANLKQYPERPYMKDNDINASSWDQYFNREAFTGYHTQGW